MAYDEVALMANIAVDIQNKKLAKIRTEIDRQEKWLMDAGYTAYNVDIAFSAIKSAVAEGSKNSENDR